MQPGREQVEAQLSRILSSLRFEASPRMSALLEYVTHAALNGDGERLKGYAIGVDVFDRPADFDASNDSIVRVQMGRLRSLLAEYYVGDGAGDPVRIDIPKGQYSPEFTMTDTAAGQGPRPMAGSARSGRDRPRFPGYRDARFWGGALLVIALAAALGAYAAITVGQGGGSDRSQAAESPEIITLAVLPLRGTGDDPALKIIGEGLVDELVSTLSGLTSLTVSSPSAASSAAQESGRNVQAIGEALGVAYVLEGSLQRSGNRVRLSTQLTRASDGRTVWAETYTSEDGNVFDLQHDIVVAIVREMRPQLLEEARQAIAAVPAEERIGWELHLRAAWSPTSNGGDEAWHRERLQLMERAVENEPDFGAAHSVLAANLTFLAGLLPDMDTPELRAKATFHAGRAQELSGDHAAGMFNIGMHYWRLGNVGEAGRYFKRTLELDETHPVAGIFLQLVPHICSPAPDDLIERLAETEAALPPDDPVRWVMQNGLARAYLYKGDLDRALAYARSARRPRGAPEVRLLLATILVERGETDAARGIHAELKASWPGLSARHHAATAIAMRCAGEPAEDRVVGLYMKAADVLAPEE